MKESVKSIIDHRNVLASRLFDQLLQVMSGEITSVNIVTNSGEVVTLDAVPLVQIGEHLVESPVLPAGGKVLVNP